jgi:hypothetical protein
MSKCVLGAALRRRAEPAPYTRRGRGGTVITEQKRVVNDDSGSHQRGL